MNFSPKKLNTFLFFKLPSAWWSGVRVQSISDDIAKTTVKYKWFNQNPFKSIYFAVLAMCAELATGALVMYYIQKSDTKFSMLVVSNSSKFSKKAIGKIIFSCDEGVVITNAINRAIKTNSPQKFWLSATGINSDNDVVANFSFEWSIKARNC